MKIAYTVVTIDYFAHAIALGDSLKKYNPDYEFIIGLLDKREAFPDIIFPSKYPVIEVEELSSPDFQGMNERYNLFELSCALKPFFAEYLVQKYNPEIVLYFDSDILIFHDFSHLEEILDKNAIALTPHVCSLINEGNSTTNPNDIAFITAGIFNAGFFGLNTTTDTSKKFLHWWKERLIHYCISNQGKGLFVDQKWLNLSFILFEDIHIIKHLGYNVAHFNIQERTLSIKNGSYFVNDLFPLIFYHYSGYDWKNPTIISKYQSQYTSEERKDLIDILLSYSKQLTANNVQFYSELKCFYGKIIEERIREERERIEEEQRRIREEQERIINSFEKNIAHLENELQIKTEEISYMKNTKIWRLGEMIWAVKNKFTK
jgi:lipopolysaccharide biosynthesis glycosyltransferase